MHFTGLVSSKSFPAFMIVVIAVVSADIVALGSKDGNKVGGWAGERKMDAEMRDEKTVTLFEK